jgi:hypothetical protein
MNAYRPLLPLFYAAALATCGAQATQNQSLPPAVEPKYPTLAQLKELNAAKNDAALDEYDVFTLMGAGRMLDAGDDAAKAERLLRDGVKAAVLMVKVKLHQLFYDVDLNTLKHPAEDPAFYSALVAFEQKAGLAVDGRFTAKEWDRLAQAARLGNEEEVWLPMKVVAAGGPGYATATGTWVMQGDKLAYPVNTVSIECSRSERQCVTHDTSIQIPSETDSASSSLLVFTNTDYYDVVDWSPEEIRALTKSSCRQTVLTIQPVTKTVFLTTTDLTEKGCEIIGRLPAPRVSTLEDPRPIMRELFKARREKVEALFFTNHMAQLKALIQ